MRIARNLIRSIPMLGADSIELPTQGLDLINAVLPNTPLQDLTDDIILNAVADVTAPAINTVLANLSISNDGIYDIWAVISVRTALAAARVVQFELRNAALASIGVFERVNCQAAVGPVGTAFSARLHIRANQQLAWIASEAFAAGETITASILAIQRLQ